MHRQGFSLVELMITLAVASILLTMAVPSLQRLIRTNQLTTQAETLLGAINLVRSEAIRRASRVTLCKSADGSSCTTSAGYEQGWLVFTDTDNNAALDAGEEVIRSARAMPAGITASGSGVTAANYLSYVADGTARAVAGGLPSSGQITLSGNSEVRIVCITAIGRARLETASC